jgi:hypothetical protein
VNCRHHRLQKLLDNDAITVALQPILTIDGEWTAVEALARFADGRPPTVWFAEAAEAGLEVELELLAIRHALAAVANLPARVCLSFNASPALILDPRLAATVRSSGVALRRLVLELTEHSPIGSYTDIISSLQPLRAEGMRLAIDDAGAGYASFAHVLQLLAWLALCPVGSRDHRANVARNRRARRPPRRCGRRAGVTVHPRRVTHRDASHRSARSAPGWRWGRREEPRRASPAEGTSRRLRAGATAAAFLSR